MTLEEAQKVAEVLETADGGCRHCALELMECAKEYFPEFMWEFTKGQIEVKKR